MAEGSLITDTELPNLEDRVTVNVEQSRLTRARQSDRELLKCLKSFGNQLFQRTGSTRRIYFYQGELIMGTPHTSSSAAGRRRRTPRRSRPVKVRVKEKEKEKEKHRDRNERVENRDKLKENPQLVVQAIEEAKAKKKEQKKAREERVVGKKIEQTKNETEKQLVDKTKKNGTEGEGEASKGNEGEGKAPKKGNEEGESSKKKNEGEGEASKKKNEGEGEAPEEGEEEDAYSGLDRIFVHDEEDETSELEKDENMSDSEGEMEALKNKGEKQGKAKKVREKDVVAKKIKKKKKEVNKELGNKTKGEGETSKKRDGEDETSKNGEGKDADSVYDGRDADSVYDGRDGYNVNLHDEEEETTGLEKDKKMTDSEGQMEPLKKKDDEAPKKGNKEDETLKMGEGKDADSVYDGRDGYNVNLHDEEEETIELEKDNKMTDSEGEDEAKRKKREEIREGKRKVSEMDKEYTEKGTEKGYAETKLTPWESRRQKVENCEDMKKKFREIRWQILKSLHQDELGHFCELLAVLTLLSKIPVATYPMPMSLLISEVESAFYKCFEVSLKWKSQNYFSGVSGMMPLPLLLVNTDDRIGVYIMSSNPDFQDQLEKWGEL